MRHFSKSSLILLGHGSSQNSQSSVPVRAHAAELRGREIFGEVEVGFLKESPTVSEVLDRATFPDVFLVPVFISEGYFSESVIPQQLGLCRPEAKTYSRRQSLAGRDVRYCGVVGSHPSMTEVLLARAREVVADCPVSGGFRPSPREVTLFVAGHGTDRSATSRRAVERQAELLAARTEYASVQAVFLEDAPEVARCADLSATEFAVVVPFFISDGLHSQEDIPVLLGECAESVQARLKAGQPTFPNPTRRNDRWLWYARAVGTEPLMAEVILERVFEAACWPGGFSQSTSKGVQSLRPLLHGRREARPR
jgi:sirohydrochlorin cobaltochelatase